MENSGDIFAESKLKQDQLLQQLKSAPISELVGVVYAFGTGGGRARGEEFWTLRTAFEAWRIHGGALETRPLTIRRKVTDAELKSLQALLPAWSVVRIHARVINDSPIGGPEALLEHVLGFDNSDAELNQFAANLQRPVTFDDPMFGTFTLDRRINWFSGKGVWNGTPVKIHLDGKETNEAQAALKTARALWQSQGDWDQRVRDYAVRQLLARKNDDWLGEGEEEVSPEQFKARMKLQSITVRQDDEFEFFHDDGDLFWGHAIQISGSLSKGLTGADTPG
jgi:hypothetical protein